MIKDLAIDLGDIETDHISIKALRRAVAEFETCIANNADMIPSHAERRRHGDRVSTGFVESAVNTVVGKSFGNCQQIRWSRLGAHLMPQTQTCNIDETLRPKFEQWCPGMKSSPETRRAA